MKAQLIFQEGSSNKFWHIDVQGNTYTVTYGRAGTDGTSKTKEFASPEVALKDAQKMIASKKKKGYVETSAKAVIVRDDHNFVGKPIRKFATSINPSSAVKVLSDYDEASKVSDKLERLAKLPEAQEMDTLIIGTWQDSHDPTLSPIIEKIKELKGAFSGLKHLFVGDMDSEECEMSWIQQVDYSDFYQHYPVLETFGVRTGEGLKLGNIKLPYLKNLIIETGGMNKSILNDVINSDLSSLEHLELWLGTDDYGCDIGMDELKPLLNKTYPNLKYLGLKNYHEQTELAKHLKGAPILNTVETLDISMGILKDEGAEALYNNDDLLKLKHINCRHHFISAAWQKKLKEKFASQNINLADAEEPYDEDYYYVEIGE